MRFTVEKEPFTAAMDKAVKFAGNGKNIPILGTVLFEAKDSTLTITATDLDKSCIVTIPAEIHDAGSVAVDAVLVQKFAKAGSGTEITAGLDKTILKVSSGRAKLSIPALPAAGFPIQAQMKPTASFSLPASELAKAISVTAYAESKEKTRYYLCGTHWTVNGAKMDVVATDGHKLSCLSFAAPVGMEALSAIVPTITLPQFTGDVRVDFSDVSVRFSSGNVVVWSKLVEATFPDYQRVIPSSPRASSRFDRDDMLSMCGRANPFSGHRTELEFEDGTLRFDAEASGGLAIADSISGEGDDFAITLNVALLSETLSTFDCDVVEFLFTDASTPIIVRNPTDTSRTALIMPMRGRAAERELATRNREAA